MNKTINTINTRAEAGFTTMETVVGLSIGLIIGVGVFKVAADANDATQSMVSNSAVVSIGDHFRAWQASNPSLDALEEGVISEEAGTSPRKGYAYELQRYDAETGNFCMEIWKEGSEEDAILYNSDKRGRWSDCTFVSDLRAAPVLVDWEPIGEHDSASYTVNEDGTFTRLG